MIGVLTEQADYDGVRNYWKVLKNRLNEEGSQLVTNCNQLKMTSPKDGKKYKTDVATAEISREKRTETLEENRMRRLLGFSIKVPGVENGRLGCDTLFLYSLYSTDSKLIPLRISQAIDSSPDI